MIEVCFPRRWRFALASVLMATLPHAAFAANDAYSPSDSGGYGDAGRVDDSYRPHEIEPAPSETYEPVRPLDGSRRDGYDAGGGANAAPPAYDSGGYGERYSAPSAKSEHYEPVPPPRRCRTARRGQRTLLFAE